MNYFLNLIISLTLCLPLLAQRDSIPAKTPAADTTKPAFTKTGRPLTGRIAVYEADLDGVRTASGEVFQHVRLTIANNAFPLNSWVLLTNPGSGRTIIARINDRLPKKQGSKAVIANVTRAIVDTLAMISADFTNIKIESILPIDSLSFHKYYFDSARLALAGVRAFRAAGKAVNGIASFYSANLDGTLTSTGERYRNHKMTAASNHFKLNTWVQVTNTRNNRSVIVRINDRMHPRMKRKGRVVDMSVEAARQLDYIEDGLTKVIVQPIEFFLAPPTQRGDSIVINLDSLRIKDSLHTADSMGRAVPPAAGLRTGTASFYSAKFDGRKTSTGEVFRNNGMTAASNDFDLRTWVRVTNLNNNRSVVVKINDRMHKKMQQKGRVVDLSRNAARQLGFLNAGLAKVKVEIVEEDAL
ncbi:septal ring lytic transglycosylase RlpA family protein [Sediminibacterium soli]|uniref:septal ring lytic transglycosylase RlpA family protein n=1 Tax=Sediminibacterium soli TaxID=2698829 RepID=UPI00137A797E|nr:septal ring lytic transglycosylase RlpA family protein [Sediminibacterium soli]NCI45938.1 septal ring lytic transglycosylase RlpA family protein [Sediminibacterium soli]